MNCRRSLALSAPTLLCLLAAAPLAAAQTTDQTGASPTPGTGAAPQGPGSPPVAAGVQATGVDAQVQGTAAGAAQPQAPGGTPAAANVDDGGLSDIVVTATRTATDLQKTPIAVTAITSDQLSSRGVTRLDDIGQFSPSFSAGTQGNRISIRGIGVDGVSQAVATVGTYIDDVFYIGSNDIGLFDVDRVEVLRGPQGTLFGRNTIGGAVQYISRKPVDRFEGYIDAIGGSYGRHDFQGAINVPLGSMLAIRLSGNTQDRNGYIHDQLNDRRNGNIYSQQGRAQLRFRPDERLTIDLEANAYHNSQDGRAAVPGGVNPNAQLAGLARLFGETRPLTTALIPTKHYTTPGFGSPDFLRVNYYSTQGTLLFNVSDNLDLKSITAYQHLSTRQAFDNDITPLNILSFPGTGRTIGTLFTQEGQLIGHVLDDRLRFTLGAYYFYNQSYQKNFPGVFIGLMQMPPLGDTQTNIRSEAAYGQASYNLTEALSVTGGLRYSHETNVAFNRAPGSPRLRSNFNNTSPYVGVNLQVDPDTLVYAKFSKGFRAGGQTVNAQLAGGNLPYGPETASTYEVGTRIELFDHRVRFNPTFFFTHWNDIQFAQTITTNAGPVPVTLNAGDATLKGVEVEGQVAITSQLLLTVAASFNDSYYRRVPPLTRTLFPFGFPPPPVPGAVLVLPSISKDSPLNRAPDERVSASLRYTLPVSDTSKLLFNISGVYTSGQYANVTIPDQAYLPATTIFQGRVQYDFGDGRFSAAVFATNLFDKYYLVNAIGTNSYAIGVDQREPARPREIGVQLTARF